MKSQLIQLIWMVSKYTFIVLMFLTIGLSTLSASIGKAQVKSVKDVSIRLKSNGLTSAQVFNAIENKTDFSFIYSVESLAELSMAIDHHGSVADLLVEIAKQAKLKFRQVNLNISVKQLEQASNDDVIIIELSQEETITGQVTDENGEAIPGVAVQIKNTPVGTITDIDGNFSISANVSDVLVFAFIGMLTQEVIISEENLNSLNVQMRGDILQLDELIVTGTSVATSRKQLGNAISTVNSNDLQYSGSQGVTGALSGKLSGALVNQNSGNPAGGISITLRGASTVFGSSDPLYVIDGVIVDNSSTELLPLGGYQQNRLVDINPDDIERIEIIKGAAAAAIYGSRASNGVVQIFTKRGKAGETKVSFSSSVRINQLRKQIEENQEPMAFEAPGSPVLVPTERFRMQDRIFRTATGTNQNISVRGGSEKTRFFTSASYSQNGGIIENTDFKRYSFRANVDQTINDWLTASVNFNYAVSRSEELPNGGMLAPGEFFGVLTGFAFLNTNYNPERRADGTYDVPLPFTLAANPVAAIETFDFNQNTDRFLGSVRLVANPFENFEVEYILGYDGSTSRATAFIPIGIDPKVTGWSRIAEKTSLLMNNDINLKYSFDISQSVKSISTAGFTQQYDRSSIFGITADRLSPAVKSTEAGSVISRTDLRSERSIRGGFLQQTFNIGDKLFVTAAIRLDQASTFGANERTHWYPKTSLSYVISDESFWQNGLSNLLNTFKIRASYGEAGNLTALSAFERFTNYNPVPIGGQTGFAPDPRAGNPDIKPERQKEIEFGFDASTFNGKLGIEFSYYDVNVEDLLLSRVLASSTGFGSRLENVGTLSNKGFEFLLRAQVLNSSQLKWNITAIYSRNENEVNDIEGGQLILPEIFGQAVVAENGESIGVFSGTYFIRDANGEISTGSDGLPITSADRKIIGDPNPDWTGSLINEFSYKNWSFRTQFDAVIGFDVFNWTDRLNSHSDLFGGGRRDAQEIRGELARGYNAATFQTFERYIEDGSFVKLREVSLAYTIRPQTSAISNITISLIGRNLLSIDGYSGWDPEVSSFGQRNGFRGMDFNEVPIPRTYQLGVKVDF